MAKGQRLAWPDVAKGISILGVVLLHVTLQVPGAAEGKLAQFNHLFDPLRMPLFFLVSGFFSTKIFSYTFGELVRRRLWFFLVPYCVWVPAELTLKRWDEAVAWDREMIKPVEYLYHLAFGVNMAWFLYALVAFNIVLWLTRSLPAGWAIALSFLPIMAIGLHEDYHMVGKAILYLPIFVIGAHARGAIALFAQRCTRPLYLAGSIAAYISGLAIARYWAQVGEKPAVELLVRLSNHLLMLGLGITGAVLVAKIPVLSPALQFIGRHTLPIYLGHPLAMTIVFHVCFFRLGIEVRPDAEVWSHSTQAWMIFAFVAAIVGGLVLWVISKIPVLQWSLKPPPLPEPVDDNVDAAQAAGSGDRRASVTRRSVRASVMAGTHRTQVDG